jgi:hydrogenase maturation factor HypF (carbamoyltransferase family)
MNAILMAQLRSHLERAGISLLEARQVPPNDGGLAWARLACPSGCFYQVTSYLG